MNKLGGILLVAFIAVTSALSFKKRLTNKLVMSGGSSTHDEKLKLIYFDGRGAGEVSRILLKISGAEFEDVRYMAKLENGKFITPEFDEAKAKGELNANMNRLPILLTPDGTTIGQSKAIERYIAKTYHMYGSTPIETAQIDCITENVRDIKDKWSKIRAIGGFMKESEEKAAAIKKWFEEGELAEWLYKLELSLPSNSVSSNHVIGNSITYADVYIWNLIYDTFEAKYESFVHQAQAKCPRITAIAKTIAEHESVKKWIETRPVTMF